MMERQKMTTTKSISDKLEALKTIDAKKIKPSFRWKHFGKIAEMEAKLALAEKLEHLRKKPVT